MHALDGTIANVALPSIQGSLSATQEQVSWVVTSYIVASAILTPLAGFCAMRFGLRRTLATCVICFTIVSMMCGAAQSLEQLVLFRALQGGFGAALVPVSQAIMMDTYPREEQGKAMAMWGVGTMVGPIAGPSLGGWLTDELSAGGGCSTSTCRSASCARIGILALVRDNVQGTAAGASTCWASPCWPSPSARSSSCSIAAICSTGSTRSRSSPRRWWRAWPSPCS